MYIVHSEVSLLEAMEDGPGRFVWLYPGPMVSMMPSILLSIAGIAPVYVGTNPAASGTSYLRSFPPAEHSHI